MKLKASLHFHTKEDRMDPISYTAKQGIDYAASRGFDVLAITHHKYFWTPREIINYGKSKRVLVIPGAEIEINNKHIVVLNCDKEIDKVETFEDLRKYKNKYPEIFVMAAHPYFGNGQSLEQELEKNIGLFDGIEHCWFYTKLINRNKRAEQIAKKHDLPFITTSDAHFLNLFEKNYIVLDVKEKTISGVFEALRQKKFENITSPLKFFRQMILMGGTLYISSRIFRLFKRIIKN